MVQSTMVNEKRRLFSLFTLYKPMAVWTRWNSRPHSVINLISFTVTNSSIIHLTGPNEPYASGER